MAIWNKSSYLMIARIIPIVLVLSAGFLWKYEKQNRMQTENQLMEVSSQLINTQNELAETKEIADTANQEKNFLIRQLGQRDEHIRRLLAEMIQLLSGSGSVDLGEVIVRSQSPGAWDGVQRELKNIVAQPPIGTLKMQSIPLAHLTPTPAGMGQMQVEQASMPTIPANLSQNTMMTGPNTGHLFNALKGHQGEILNVNDRHRFVVISQGSDNGIARGAYFDAFFGEEKIGRLKVGTVYDRVSTASIVKGEAQHFREGSMIRLEPITA